MKRLSARNLILAFAGFLFVGCASSATQPEAQSPSAAADSSAQKAGGQAATASRAVASGSSLDAHREGKSAGSGPLKEIYFDFDRYDLRDDARATLKANAAWLKANPSARVEIEGHCDERGTSEYNLALGAKRAQTAKDYLLTLGISPQRIATISYGEELAVCRQQKEDCYQQNRRDRFVVRGALPTS
ncbi:MAG: peptidoglycan-associated lipoprotein Pal [Candidatus Binatia bacterium]